MTDAIDHRHFLDKRRARFLAGLIGALALTGVALVYLKHQGTDPAGNPLSSASAVVPAAPAVDPRYEECRAQRTADIAGMLSDGVIDQAKHDEFLARALQTCAGMFPPEG